MEELYDYSRHKYCITFDFDHNIMMSKKIAIDDDKEMQGPGNEFKYNVSLLYRTSTGEVVARGDSADEINRETGGSREDLFYVPNIFSELINIYLRSHQNEHDHIVIDKMIRQEAMDVLKNIVQRREEFTDYSNEDFYYTFILPTTWDYKTREALIRPLFIEVGLIHENDGQGRLIFFTKLDSIFQYLQGDVYRGINMNLKHGDQYIMCLVDFQGQFRVDLELVSVQYPALTTRENKYVPQLLKEAHFAIPFGSKEVRSSLRECLKKHCKTAEILGILDTLLTENDINLKYSKNNLDSLTYQKFFSYQPFQDPRYLYDKQYSLTKMQIDAIQLISIQDIYESIFDSVERVFKEQMNNLLDTDDIKSKSMIIHYTDRIKNNFNMKPLLKFIEKLAKMYSEERNRSYELIKNGETLSFFLRFPRGGAISLIQKSLHEFNVYRDPIILSRDTTIDQSKSSLNPIYYINIDMSPAQINVIITYVKENKQVKRTETIQCNMPPLNSFITRSESYQRPILRINDRQKQHLETFFADYFEMYSDPSNQTITSKNRLKKIRNLFVSSKSNLLEKLAGDVKINDFFVLNDKCSYGVDSLVTIYHPCYIFFFMITYLYSFNEQLEENIERIYGADWRGNNIWYGVSIDKHLLDTVFGSMKKLGKLFFASGILQEGNNTRRAKFCIHGEEILPAIQHKYRHLDFKMKSYFVAAQIFSKHIQLTLHQVVKPALPGEDAATIVIQDEIIYIDDVYDSLCKNILASTQIDREINHCLIHNAHDAFDSLQTCTSLRQNLKLYVSEILKMSEESLDLDCGKKLNINDGCDCSIDIILRDIIEVNLKSVIEDIATVIAASLTNKRIFGNYETDYLFILGNPFGMSYNSVVYTVYTMIMKKSINDCVHVKEKDTPSFVPRESFMHLLEPVTRTRPYMYERFVTGTLCQVSGETYALRLNFSNWNVFLPFFHKDNNDNIRNTIENDGSYSVFIQKGKPISTKGCMVEVPQNYGYGRSSHVHTLFDLFKLHHSSNLVPKKYTLLDSDLEGINHPLKIIFERPLESVKMIVECRRINYSYSLEISVRLMGHDVDYTNIDFRPYEYFNQPLTLAYI